MASATEAPASLSRRQQDMRILGLVALTHDTGIALVEDGRIVMVLEEERHSREKHTMWFPRRSLTEMFATTGSGLAGIDVITVPWDQARLRRTFAAAVMRGLPASLNLIRDSAHPTQDGAVVAMNSILRMALWRYFPDEPRPPIVGVGHHESHAAMFFVSPFEDATVIVLDGYGDDSSSSVFTGEGHHLERQWHGSFFDSLGMVYSVVTRHLGFEFFEEGTVMALAALGTDRLVDRMRDLILLEPNGRFRIDMRYFDYDRYGAIRPFKRPFLDAFGPPRVRGGPLTDHHRDLAYALQAVTEDVVLHVAKAARRAYPSRNLCLVGGVALNCVANARLVREAGFDRIWVPPCASDTGAPLGSALYHYHQTLGQPRRTTMSDAYFGRAYSEEETTAALVTAGLAFERLDDRGLIERVASDLAAGRIVGWFQGRYEIGPRALGNRSILASPLDPNVRDTINARVKVREPFRPFAPSVLAERAAEFFEIDQPDPFMTLAPRVRPEMAKRIPAAVHVDGTARIQTVERDSNPRYHALIAKFGELTGVPILLNTSFNKQEPIVATPQHAISCFLRTELDVLVMGNIYVTSRPAEAVRRARQAFEVVEINTRSGD
ncbi:MAG: carbamoyltransferase C-terminal domain-containing protein [Hyphomicrobiaceae bacterium]